MLHDVKGSAGRVAPRVRASRIAPQARTLASMALREYLTTEVGEDWLDGLISRREAIRRLVLMGLTASAAAALLDACAQAERASAVAGTPSKPGQSAPAAASVGALSAARGGPVDPAEAPNGRSISFAGPAGEIQGYLAEATAPSGGMLVVHENRGLTDHIRSIARRLAAEGYTALAVDLLSREGGTASLGDPANVPAILARAAADRLVADLKAGVDELERRVPGGRLGTIGFCFGGGMVWALLDAGESRLSAAVPFYGPAPERPDFSRDKAAVLAIYAELDARVNTSRDRAVAALEAARLEYMVRTYPGVDHAFFNDTGGRYDATQAAAAWRDTLDWLARHLRG
ncbi:MAG TPA: dienelactone hydrolase family protein [Candidatus Limnocylindrales bacterium]